jgi:cobalt-zinc-cadmium efflux system membrane fusion protein
VTSSPCERRCSPTKEDVRLRAGGDYWIRRPVTLGKRLGDLVEIRSGLAAGQRIVTDGSFLLKSDVLRKKMGAGCAD